MLFIYRRNKLTQSLKRLTKPLIQTSKFYAYPQGPFHVTISDAKIFTSKESKQIRFIGFLDIVCNENKKLKP